MLAGGSCRLRLWQRTGDAELFEKIMNATHLHLMLNHIPVIGTGFALLLLLVALAKKSDEWKKVSFGFFVLIALLTVPAYLTGEPAEDGVKGLPGVTKAIIEQHEEAAGVAFGGTALVGVLALTGLVLFRRARSVPGWFARVIVLFAVIAGGLMAWAANLGGQVRHTEIRPGSASPPPISEPGKH
jgi:uncharacterized membrane protein